MKISKVWAVYFSATGTTEKTVKAIANAAAKVLGADVEEVSFTLPGAREEVLRFAEGELVVFGTPVYAGRVPNLMLPFLKEKVRGNGALGVPVVLFGNRAYDDALTEQRDIMEANGFHTVAGGAFVGEHSFSTTLGAGRPDAADMDEITKFGAAIGEKILALETVPAPIDVSGREEIVYYQPKDENGKPINILKVKPLTDADKCTYCGWCAAHCPMGSISFDDPTAVLGKCIKCCACVKGCPTGAKYFDDPGYLLHKKLLEEGFGRRAGNTVFL